MKTRCTYTVTQIPLGSPDSGWVIQIDHPSGDSVTVRFGRTGGMWVQNDGTRWTMVQGRTGSPPCLTREDALRLARKVRDRNLPD